MNTYADDDFLGRTPQSSYFEIAKIANQNDEDINGRTATVFIDLIANIVTQYE